MFQAKIKLIFTYYVSILTPNHPYNTGLSLFLTPRIGYGNKLHRTSTRAIFIFHITINITVLWKVKKIYNFFFNNCLFNTQLNFMYHENRFSFHQVVTRVLKIYYWFFIFIQVRYFLHVFCKKYLTCCF